MLKPQRSGPFPYIPVTERKKLTWPGGAHVALWVVPNIEFFPLNEPVPFSIGIVPDVLGWSMRDYGARVGTFRLMDVMSKHGIRGTVALNSEVCDAYPQIIDEAMKRDWEFEAMKRDWEFMGHGQSNARTVDGMEAEAERAAIKGTFDRIEEASGTRPKGWLSPGVRMTWHTLDFLAETGCRYFCDFVNDDVPYLMDVNGTRMVSIPYSSEINDLPAFLRNGRTAEEFGTMIRRQFDVLYREGAQSGRVMAICLHPFLIGVPHRIDVLDEALAYICGHDKVWLATGSEIVEHYLKSDACV